MDKGERPGAEVHGVAGQQEEGRHVWAGVCNNNGCRNTHGQQSCEGLALPSSSHAVSATPHGITPVPPLPLRCQHLLLSMAVAHAMPPAAPLTSRRTAGTRQRAAARQTGCTPAHKGQQPRVRSNGGGGSVRLCTCSLSNRAGMWAQQGSLELAGSTPC